MSFFIAPAKEFMISRIAALERECFSCPWSEGMLRDAFDNPCARFYAIAEDDGSFAESLVAQENPDIMQMHNIIGYAGFYAFAEDAELVTLAIDERYRRRGLAAALLDYITDTATISGFVRMLLEVRESNFAARSLYEKHGFSTLSVRKNYYRSPAENAVVMMKNLDLYSTEI